jgi:adenosylcobinamide kinase/adenosylcobinamide-phosphate guanylyltransferase
MIELILGGARSGKSRFAERSVHQRVNESIATHAPIYIATATAGDTEMQARIAAHQQQRTAQENLQWHTVEVPIRLADALREFNSPEQIILVDCLTLWLSNCLHRGDLCWKRERADFLALMPEFSGQLILVSNEVGQGVVPMGELSRRFVDEAGRLHQDLAALADRVVFCIAGLPQVLKCNLARHPEP